MADLLATNDVRVQRRVTRYAITRPTSGPPYNDDTGYPSRDAGTDISGYVVSWAVSQGNRNASSQATLRVMPGLTINIGDEVVVEEQYSNKATGVSGWIKHGTWYAQDLDYSLTANDETGTLTCFDAGHLLSCDIFLGTLEGDIVEIPKGALDLIEDPAVTGGDRYIYADGTAESHTYNWTSTPSAILWADEFPISEEANAIDVVNGRGEVHIERILFGEDRDDGGLENPDDIFCHYWRYALAGDQSDVTLTDATSSTLVVSGASWTIDAYKGQHAIITSGDGMG